MKKLYFKLTALVALLCISFGAKAIGWPANFQGVMLQGFYWDSYKGGSYGSTKWTDLTNQADELSKYFKLIWVPNSARANGEGGGGNGYMPIYWFTNHNCAYGTEAQLKTMISTFKAKGVGFIEDVVVNHRVGASNWYNFPSEQWNGRTYQLTNGAICSTDEMWRQGGQGCPYTRGAADTGEDFDGARDLDHTNATVQDNVKNYCKFLIDDMGYVGFRLDMVKGYGGQYTKIYNQYSRPTYSVGEYFDGNYDKVAAWINATGKESAAFDFPGKYAMNEAFGSNDMRKLAWNNPSGAPQPAGMIHHEYTQLSVTFVDNHDTFRDGSKFPSDANIMAANAFILFSPGTPCIFWPHYYANKTAMQALIAARNEVGIHNLSAVKVLKLEQNCYAAEITGTKGKAVVKIGSDMSFNPGNGYNMKASGTNYCVWTTAQGGITPTPTPDGNPFTVYWDNSTAQWATPTIHYWGNTESEWPGVAMSKVTGNVWSYTVPAGTTGILFNAGDGDPTKTPDFGAQANHIYNQSGDQGTYSGGGGNGGNGGNYPAKLYLMGHVNGYSWATDKGLEATGNKGIYNWPNATIDKADDNDGGFFSFATVLGSDWDAVNAGDRYGSGTKDENIALGGSSTIVLYGANVSASGAQSWKLAPGTYSITADLANMKLTIAQAGTVPTPNPGGNENEDPKPTPNPGTYPATVYVMGNVDGCDWNTTKGVAAQGDNGVYFWPAITVDGSDEGYGYFAFVTKLGTTGDPAIDWDTEINLYDRYGAPAANTPFAINQTLDVTLYAAGVDASASQSWKVAGGKYDLKLDLPKMKVSLYAEGAAVEGIDADDTPAVYFNLQGQKVTNPEKGIYIKVQGNKTSKVVL